MPRPVMPRRAALPVPREPERLPAAPRAAWEAIPAMRAAAWARPAAPGQPAGRARAAARALPETRAAEPDSVIRLATARVATQNATLNLLRHFGLILPEHH